MNQEKPVNEVAKVQQGAVETHPGQTPSLLNFVAMAVKDPDIDVGKLEALLRMQREIVADEAKALFNQAMGRLQAVLPRGKKNGVVEYPVDKNKPDGPKKKAFAYARWEDIDAVIRPLLRAEGFSLSFNTAQRVGDGGGLIVTGELLHVAGHSKTASMALPLDTSGGKSNLQGYASSTSFGSRYVAKMLLNLVFEGEDDNGKLADTHFITPDQVAELDALIKEVGREEGPFLDRLFAGAVRSFEEIEVGGAFMAAKSTLEAIRAQQQRKATP